MAIKQRTPAVQFDDIPGSLPAANVPHDVDVNEIANIAIEKINSAQPSDWSTDALWRDLYAFTGTYRTFFSAEKALPLLSRLRDERRCSPFAQAAGSTPTVSRFGENCSWIDVDIEFKTHYDQDRDLVGLCKGYISIIPSSSDDGGWRIWMLRTWLENFEGRGNPDVLEPSLLAGDECPTETAQHSSVNGNGTANPRTGADMIFDAVVVGGGQAGLFMAGRLKALGLSYLLIDDRETLGQIWMDRYESLKWHTPTAYGSMPFGHRYPSDWDKHQLPIKQISAGMRTWAEKFGIEAWTSTAVESAKWSAMEKRWKISTLSKKYGERTITSEHLVLCIGAGLKTPRWPDWAASTRIKESGFDGVVLHGAEFRSCRGFEGKRGIVIGMANTGHDIAEAMADAGMEATIVQRSPTCIVPVEWVQEAYDPLYNSEMPTDLGDRISQTLPLKIGRELARAQILTNMEAEKQRFEALEKAGVRVDWDPDLSTNLFFRFGGHYHDIGACARIVKGEIKARSKPIKGLTERGLAFEDGEVLDADLVVVCTGYNGDFRKDAAAIVGHDAADAMDDFWAPDAEGEIRGLAKFAGHERLYYLGGGVAHARYYSKFIGLQIQAEALGKPLERFEE